MIAPGQLQIRNIRADDSVEALTDFLHRAYAGLGALGFNYTAVDQSVAETRAAMVGKECYLGLIDARLIATLLLGPASEQQAVCEWYRRPGVWIVGRLAVEPAFRGQTIGSRMLAFAEERARALGATEAALDTAEGAEHLIALYTKRGYRPVGHVQWPGKSYRSQVLSKALA